MVYYINAGTFDAYRAGATAEAAVAAMFPKATVSHIGTEPTGEQVFNVEDEDGEFYTVGVEARPGGR